MIRFVNACWQCYHLRLRWRLSPLLHRVIIEVAAKSVPGCPGVVLRKRAPRLPNCYRLVFVVVGEFVCDK